MVQRAKGVKKLVAEEIAIPVYCQQCKWFDQKQRYSVWHVGDPNNKYHDEEIETIKTSGYCRVNAPIIDSGTGDIRSIWPWVEGTDWCGKGELL